MLQPLDHVAAAATSYNGELHVVGGGYLDRKLLSNKWLIYDPASYRWVQGANLPEAHGALTANFIDGTLYVIGGVNSTETLTSTWCFG